MCDINICGIFIICCFFAAPFHKRSVRSLRGNGSICWQCLSKCDLNFERSQLIEQSVCMCVISIALYAPFSVLLAAICAYKKGETCHYLMKLTKSINGQILILFFVSSFFKLLHKWLEFIYNLIVHWYSMRRQIEHIKSKSNATIWNWYLIFLTTNVHHRMRMLNNNEILAGLTVCRSTICQVSLREFKQKAHVTFFRRAEQYVLYTAGTTNIFWFGTQSKWAGFVGSGCLITLRYKVWNVLWNWLHFKGLIIYALI